jgi:hypothetical protein
MYKIVQGFLCFLCELSFQPIESGCQKFHYPWEVRFESPILGCSGHAWDWAFKSSINCTNTQGTPRCIREQNASYVNLKTDILESGCQDLLSHFKFSSFPIGSSTYFRENLLRRHSISKHMYVIVCRCTVCLCKCVYVYILYNYVYD